MTVSADPLPFPPTPHKSPTGHPQPQDSSANNSHTQHTPSHAFPLSAILPIPGDELFRISAAITPNIAYYLPRNVNLSEISRLATRLDAPEASEDGGRRDREWVEVEQEIVGDRVKAVTAYYGSLIMDGNGTEVD